MKHKKFILKSWLILQAMAVLGIQSLAAQEKSVAASTNVTEKAGAVFNDVADRALQAMKRRAEELNVKGVAVVAYCEGDTVQAWSSKMVVVGQLTSAPSNSSTNGSNLLGIAYAKAAEMADTLADSGSKVRPPKTGEFGWRGGVVSKGKTGILIAAFSGGASADDVKISKAGMEILAEKL